MYLCKLLVICRKMRMYLYVSRDGQQYGPYSVEDARAHLVAGSLLPTDSAFLEGMTDWAPLEEVLAATAQPVLSPDPLVPQPASPVVESAPVIRARSAMETPAKAKKGRRKKPNPKTKSKAPSAGFGGLLVKYKVVLAMMVIIATGLYIYNASNNAAPDQGEDPSALDTDKEMEEQTEQYQKEDQGKSGSSSGGIPADPGDPGDPSDPGGV